MKRIHIPEVMAAQLFDSFKMSLIMDIDESDEKTYAIQYACSGQKRPAQYRLQSAPKLEKTHFERYRNKFVTFRLLCRSWMNRMDRKSCQVI